MNIKRMIIKIGSSSLIDDNNQFSYEKIVSLVKQISILKSHDVQCVLVSSGAIAAGMKKLNIDKKPNNMALKQACAAVGQSTLMKIYDEIFALYHLNCAQILVNHDDFDNRKRMSHLTDTMEALFEKNIIPIINENDALSVDEIKVGDNDTLSALFVPMINADMLVIVSDVDGLYDKNPQLSDAKKIDIVERIDENVWALVSNKVSKLGTGGMATKLKAGIIANDCGADMIIMNNNKIDSLSNTLNNISIGTLFKGVKTLSSKNHWLLYKTNSKGTIIIDDGAKEALLSRKSLLPKGVIGVCGEFLTNFVVDISDNRGNIIAKGITNYSSDIISLIIGKSTDEIQLPIYKKKEIIHADNYLLVEGEKYEHFTR